MKEEILKTFLYRLKNKLSLIYIKLLGSIITILSGFLPFSDNILSWYNPLYNSMVDGRGVSMRVDVWLISLYLTILGVAIGAWMKAYYMTFLIPMYSSLYSLSVYVLMMKGVELDADWVHRVGFLFLLAPGIYIVYRLNSHIKDLILKDEIQSKTIDRIIEQNTNNNNEN